MSNKPKSPFGGSPRKNDDDDEKEDRPAGPFGRSTPSKPGGGSPIGGKSPFSSRGRNDDDDDEEEEDEKPARPAFGSGSKSPFGPKTSTGNVPAAGAKPGSPSSPAGGSSFGQKTSTGNVPAAGAKPGGPSSFGQKPANPPSPFAPKPSPFGPKTAEKKDDDDKKDDRRDERPAGGGSFGASKSPFGGGKPPDKRDDDRRDERPAGGGMFGASKSPFGGGKPADKKDDDRRDDRSGSPFSASKPAFGSGKPADKRDDKPADKKDDKPGSPFGGLRSPFGGGKKDDKPADKKDDKPGSPFGGLKSPFGGGKPADKKDDRPAGGSPFGAAKPTFGAKPAEKKDDKPGSPFGGLKSPFGGGKPADKKDDRPQAKSSSAAADKPAGGGLFGRLPFGAKSSDAPPAKKDDKRATVDKPAGGGLFGRLPFGAKSGEQKDDKGTSAKPGIPAAKGIATPGLKTAGPAVTDSKKGISGKPPARGEKTARPLERGAGNRVEVQYGLSLDQKLDLVGYLLMFVSVLMFFGVVQPDSGSLTSGIANVAGGLFGKAGTVGVLVAAFGVGLWLLIRHFNENPLLIRSSRVVGLLLIFLALITTAHFYEMLFRPVPDMKALIKVSDAVAKSPTHLGGGWIGGEIYKGTIQVATEWGVPVVLLAGWIIGFALATNLTAQDVTLYLKSVGTWFARFGAAAREAREVRRAQAQARAAQATPLVVETPAGAGTPAAAALAGPSGSKRGIPATTSGAAAPRLNAPASAATGAKSAPFGKAPVKGEEVPPPEEAAKAPEQPAAEAKQGLRFNPFGRKPAEAEKVPVAAGGKLADKKEEKPAARFGGLFGARPAGGAAGAKPAPADTKKTEEDELDAAEPKPQIVKPSPFGAKSDSPAAKLTSSEQKAVASTATEKPAEKPADKKEEPAKASPLGRFNPFGQKPGAKPESADKAAGEKVEAKEDKKEAAAAKPASAFGRLNPFGAKSEAKPEEKTAEKPVAQPEKKDDAAAKPSSPFARANPFGQKPADKLEDKPAAKVEDKPADKQQEAEDNKAAEPAKPSPFGKPGAFGAKPAARVEDKPADKQQEAEDNKAAEPAKPSPFGKPGAFGAKPAARVEDKPADKQQEAEDNKAAEPAKPSPFGKPSALGAKPAARVEDKPADRQSDAAEDEDKEPAAAKPTFTRTTFGVKPGEKTDIKPDDDQDEDEQAPAAAKPASPFGKSGSIFGAKPASTNAKPTPADDDEVEEDDEAEVKPAAARPSSPFAAKPSPFAKPAERKEPLKPSASQDEEDEDMDGEPPSLTPIKPASPFGSRPAGGVFGAKPTPATPFGSKSNNPAASSAEDEEPEDDDAEEAKTPFKPATPIGKPVAANTNFGAPAFRPAPKSGSLATKPPVEDEDEEEPDDSVRRVDEDDDDLPRSNGPRPTVTGAVGTTSSAMPRPANPVEPRRPASPFGARPLAASASNQPNDSDADEEDGDEVQAPIAAKTAEPISRPASGPVINRPSIAKSLPNGGVLVRSKGGNHPGEVPDYADLLESGSEQRLNDDILREKARIIEDTLKAFGSPGNVVEINPGPVITQFGVEPGYLPARGGKNIRVKVGQIARLDADLALALAARSIRIEAPVPGKGYVGIEVPNPQTSLVSLRDVMDTEEFQKINSKLRIALGLSVDGAPISADLTQMPHLLIAGTTGSGKSVCVNAIISCLLLNNTPDDLKMIMVDPKRVELTGYNGIPHLVSPVVVDLERIVGVLKWVTREMDERYKKFSSIGARNIADYNKKIGENDPRLPYLVVVIDELADLMMLAPDETEKVLTRLAQMARATGIHLIISTQRPSVDVVTGLIKANFPARISFAVASSVDSRVILDQPGAEKLLGKGDMLYQSPEAAAPLRMQGVYLSDSEISRITGYWKGQKIDKPHSALSSVVDFNRSADPVQSRSERFGGSGGTDSKPRTVFGAPPSSSTGSKPATISTGSKPATPSSGEPTAEDEEMYERALELVTQAGKPSLQMLQRRLRIGYNHAAKLIDMMEKRGAISPAEARNAATNPGDENTEA